MIHRRSLVLETKFPGAVVCIVMCLLSSQLPVSHSSLLFSFSKASMNCSQQCICQHNALVNTMKSYSEDRKKLMGVRYRPELIYYDTRSEYMVFLGTFAPMLHRIAEIECRLTDGHSHSVMTLLNGVDEFMDISLNVRCLQGENLIWDVPSWHTSVNIFISDQCKILPRDPHRGIMVPLNMWILEISGGGNEIMESLWLTYTLNTLTLSVTGATTSTTPKHWHGVDLVSSSFINLRYNHLEEFNCPFQLTKRLDTLNLEGNRLSFIPPCLLRSQIIKLSYLSLAHNMIPNLTQLYAGERAHTSPDIYVINLSFNLIKKVEAIVSMSNLVVLDLSHNSISEISEDAFHYMTSLEALYLSHNKIVSFASHQFAPVSKLCILDVSYNYLSEFKQEHLPNGDQALTLDIGYNSLRYPPLTNCAGIKDFNVELKVYSEGNPFHCDCKMIEYENCQKWIDNQVLNRSGERNVFKDLGAMTCVTPTMVKNRSLAKLSFHSFCYILDECPDACSCTLINVHNLIVNCSGRNLLDMPDKLPSYPNATVSLYLDHNPLHIVSQRAYLRNLTELHAHHCMLTSVTPVAMLLLQDIRVLVLHDNLLTRLPAVVKNITFSHARNVSLHNNPWICACDTLWMTRWLAKHRSSLWLPGNITCHNLRKPVEELHQNDLNCNASDPNNVDRLLVVVLVMTTIGTVLCVLYFARGGIEHLMSEKMGINLQALKYRNFFSKYDLFISFCQETRPWVQEVLIPYLNRGVSRKQRLALHERDSPNQEPTESWLLSAISSSRCAVIVLTQDFVRDGWCSMQIEAICQRLHSVGCPIVIISVGHIDLEELPTDVKEFLSRHNFFCWDSENCWETLHALMPNRGSLNDFTFDERRRMDSEDLEVQPTVRPDEDHQLERVMRNEDDGAGDSW